MTFLGLRLGNEPQLSVRNIQSLGSLAEENGYGELWMTEGEGRDSLTQLTAIGTVTSQIRLGTGILPMFSRSPLITAMSSAGLASVTGDRFILGLGVSHEPLVSGLRQLEYLKPIEAMRAYLEQMNMSPYSSKPPEKQPICLLAALGPRMLELSAELADGAHPYWTNPEHTQQARKIIGDEKLLCVEQKVVITTNQEIAY